MKFGKTLRPPDCGCPIRRRGEPADILRRYGEWMGTPPRPGRTSPGCGSCGRSLHAKA
ncbi:hypothetical protein BZL30_9517 [Mycobacterium kansasii]|uniref:Uncharacterized protein n=1 Tax=Mycobacterium kansasii TaxID=1768 RepID=A0A1V3W961_MYCKA|nr:hypothetical protein BZL30_9517 [Mycobacterium kansasii]